MSAASELEKIAREVAVCTKCDLCKSRTNTVPGEGSPNARVMFIGEAPGFHEDQQGRPFVGQSGQLLNKLLSAINLPREDVFIANVVKCHPPQNLDPTPEQMAACKPYLDRQIAAINPRLIVTLGRFSMARYWPNQRISQIHGQPKQADGRLYLPMFHPAAALRDRERTLVMFKQDGFKIPALLEKAEEVARNEIWGYPVQDEPEVAPPLAVAEPPAVFEPVTSPAPAPVPVAPMGTNEEGPAPFVAPVEATLQAENKETPPRGKAKSRPVKVKPQEVEAEPEAVEVTATTGQTVDGPELELVGGPLPMASPPAAPDAEVAPGLALSEAGQGRAAGRGRKQPSATSPLVAPKGEAARPRKKRPDVPGEQLTMF